MLQTEATSQDGSGFAAFARIIDTRRWCRVLLSIVALLSLAGLEVVLARHHWGPTPQFGLSKLFDLDVENNVPTWFSSASLLLCAIALWLNGKMERARRGPDTVYWFGIAAVFVLLSLDETASIHEKLHNPLHNLLHTGGYLHFAWVIPAFAFVLGFLAFTFRFLRRLPVRTRNRFLLAGFIYVSGGLGMEMLAGNYEFIHGVHDLQFGLMCVVEETMEMLGAILFLRALLLHLGSEFTPAETCAAGAPTA